MSEKNVNINDSAANDEELDFMLGRKKKRVPQSEEKPAVMPKAAPLGGGRDVGTVKFNKVADSTMLNSTVSQGEGSLSAIKSADEALVEADDDLDADADDIKEDAGTGHERDNVASIMLGMLKGIIYIAIVVVAGVCLALFVIIPIFNDIFAFDKKEAVKEVTIPELATLDDVADILYENGLISYPKIFKMYAGFINDNGEYVAGDYTLSTTLSYRQLLASFKSSKEKEIISITIPEGYTTDEIINLFVENGIGTREGFIDVINNYDWREDYNYWFIDELEEYGYSEDRFYRLDGYLYPDTYYFYSDSSEVTAISKLLDNFSVKFTDTYREYAKSLGFTTDQIVTIASMIESEAKYLAEFPLVSSVFHNRLKKSQFYPFLESDATIMYAIMHDTGERPERLTSTEYDSPYNTYKNKGLPPGPISNPGYNALTYALYPKNTDYYYFVANNDGYSVFSKTYAEHLAAVKAVADGTAISTLRQGTEGGVVEDYE
ncbi:MAG: endolytic transglycosylase MltG [Clostridiales bacterium]|nr:endolytic transglycosylase MltG [Clostridiales bacterium]